MSLYGAKMKLFFVILDDEERLFGVWQGTPLARY